MRIRQTTKLTIYLLVGAMFLCGGLPVFAGESADAKASGHNRTATLSGVQQLQTADDRKLSKQTKLAKPEDLLIEYMQRQVSDTAKSYQAKSNRKSRGSKLKGNDAAIYRILQEELEAMAAGERESAVIRIPVTDLMGEKQSFKAEELGVAEIVRNGAITPEAEAAFLVKFDFDFETVINALLTDLPYDLYWYDKTEGCTLNGPMIGVKWADERFEEYEVCFAGRNPAWIFHFAVSRDYSRSGRVGTTAIDTEKTVAANTAADAAKQIITSHAGERDLEKLNSYLEEICDLTEYNYTAIEYDADYGDPWQMIHVFDGDPSTKVVCEGYSKAFQFLCDVTTFRSKKIESRIVTGVMRDEEGDGDHMWNVIHMDDRNNYLVDITNCDDDGVGAPDKLFLKGAAGGDPDAGYMYQCDDTQILYIYDTDTKAIFDPAELTLVGSDYEEVPEGICYHEQDRVDAIAPTCTKAGNTEYWVCVDCGTAFLDEEGTAPLPEGGQILQPLGHDYRYEEADYKWSDDRETCTATVTCAHDPSHTVSETAATSAVTKEATCEEPGATTYSAEFAKPGFAAQTSTEVIPAAGHELVETPAVAPSYEMDGNSAFWTCGKCGRTYSDAEGRSEVAKDSWVIPKLVPKAGGTAEGVDGSIVEFIDVNAGTVAYKKAPAPSGKSVTVPAAVKIGGRTYKIIRVNANAFRDSGEISVTLGKNINTIKPKAFYKSKVKIITLKTKKLTKKSVRNSLKGSRVKTIKVKVGSKKTNKKFVKKYKKIFTKKNVGKKVVVR